MAPRRASFASVASRDGTVSPVSPIDGVNVFDDEFAEDYADSIHTTTSRRDDPFQDPIRRGRIAQAQSQDAQTSLVDGNLLYQLAIASAKTGLMFKIHKRVVAWRTDPDYRALHRLCHQLGYQIGRLAWPLLRSRPHRFRRHRNNRFPAIHTACTRKPWVSADPRALPLLRPCRVARARPSLKVQRIPTRFIRKPFPARILPTMERK